MGCFMRYGILVILTFFLESYGFSFSRDHNEEYSERLFHQAQKVIEQSKQLREEIAQKRPIPKNNYRSISNEDENLWEKEMDQIISD